MNFSVFTIFVPVFAPTLYRRFCVFELFGRGFWCLFDLIFSVKYLHTYTFLLFAHASTNPRYGGDGWLGVDLYSGWNWVARKNESRFSSPTSILVPDEPEKTSPAFSISAIYAGFTSYLWR